jgi:hypothetical protein
MRVLGAEHTHPKGFAPFDWGWDALSKVAPFLSDRPVEWTV